jgi:hypothetical protein
MGNGGNGGRDRQADAERVQRCDCRRERAVKRDLPHVDIS